MSGEKLLLDDDEEQDMFGGEEEDVDVPMDAPQPSVKHEETAPPPSGDPAEVDGRTPAASGTFQENGADASSQSLPAQDHPHAVQQVEPTLTASSQSQVHDTLLGLPTQLPQTSPFSHHNTGPSSDRLRNALARITNDPSSDVEAWQALITEAQSCYRQLLPSLFKLKINTDPEVELINRKLDWIECCYGAVLHQFPTATQYYVQLLEVLLRVSALTADEESQCGNAMGMMLNISSRNTATHLSNLALTTPDQNVNVSPSAILLTDSMLRTNSSRVALCEERIKRAFMVCLGVNMDGTPALFGDMTADQAATINDAISIDGARTILGGLQCHSLDLWLLYIQKCTWNSSREASGLYAIPQPPPGYIPAQHQASVLHQQYEESLRAVYRQRMDHVKSGIVNSYETALSHGAGYAQSNHTIWKRYTNFVKTWTVPVDYSASLMNMAQFLPPTMPPQSISPPDDPAYMHTTSQKQLSQLRSIYQRGVTHPMTGLDQFWQEYEAFEKSHSESLGAVLVAEWLPKYQHARSVYLERNRVWSIQDLRARGSLATPPVGFARGDSVKDASSGGVTVLSRKVGSEEESAVGKKMSDSEYIFQMDEECSILSHWRRRQGYERTNPERLANADFDSRVRSSYNEEASLFARHPEVWYEWSQWELLHGSTNPENGASRDSSLVAAMKVGDLNTGGSALRAVAVLSLGMQMLPDCALLALAQSEILERFIGMTQDDKRTSEGMEKPSQGAIECIKVLEDFVERSPTTLGFVLLQRIVRRHQGIEAARAVFARARRTLLVRAADLSGVEEKSSDDKTAEDVSEGVSNEAGQRMVTNRVKSGIVGSDNMTEENDDENKPKKQVGFITWHLYAAHATMEHRLSKKPQVAARVYELGLRNHRTFLSNPPYVLHYASLLLELNDEENLRSLLTRAVAACEEEDINNTDTAALHRRREIQRPLWDMMIKFEAVFSSSSNSDASSDIASTEARRRRALYGPGQEDIILGGDGAPDEDEDRILGTGAQKASLNEQLIRVEGYDISSRIANGLGRMVDVLTVTGAIGNGELDTSSLDFSAAATASLSAAGTSSELWGDECAGGPSDVSYVKRLKFQRESRTRALTSSLSKVGGAQGSTGGAGKLLTRERSNVGSGNNQANAIAIQNAPEWLRPLMSLLPSIPRFGRGASKPPPHLTEMTLSTLKTTPLPARPTSAAANGSSRKRGRHHANDGDSSDEENGNAGGGYSSHFRSRQRARLLNESTTS